MTNSEEEQELCRGVALVQRRPATVAVLSVAAVLAGLYFLEPAQEFPSARVATPVAAPDAATFASRAGKNSARAAPPVRRADGCLSTALVPWPNGIVACPRDAAEVEPRSREVRMETAQEVLFGHCGGDRLSCPTFFPFETVVTKEVQPVPMKYHEKPFIGANVSESIWFGDPHPGLRDRWYLEAATVYRSTSLGGSDWADMGPPPISRMPLLRSAEAPPNPNDFDPPLRYDVAVFVQFSGLCPHNLFHGTFEAVLPLWHTLEAIKRVHGAKRVVIFNHRVPLVGYGSSDNDQCKPLRTPPYGLGEPSNTGFLYTAMARHFERLDIVGVGDGWRSFYPLDARRVLTIVGQFRAKVTYRGLSSRCFGSAAQLELPFRRHWLEYPAIEPMPLECESTLRSLVRSGEKSLGIPAGSDVAPLEGRSPRVLVVLRRTVTRQLVNATQLVAALQRGLQAGRPDAWPGEVQVDTVYLERLTKAAQIAVIRNATVVVAARGAGLVMVMLFARPGTVIVPLSPKRAVAVPLLSDSALPWMPLPGAPSWLHVVHVMCDVVVPTGPWYGVQCVHLSSNTCNLRCDPMEVVASVAIGLHAVREGRRGTYLVPQPRRVATSNRTFVRSLPWPPQPRRRRKVGDRLPTQLVDALRRSVNRYAALVELLPVVLQSRKRTRAATGSGRAAGTTVPSTWTFHARMLDASDGRDIVMDFDARLGHWQMRSRSLGSRRWIRRNFTAAERVRDAAESAATRLLVEHFFSNESISEVLRRASEIR